MEYMTSDQETSRKPSNHRWQAAHRRPRVLLLSPYLTSSSLYVPFAEHLAERLAREGLHVTSSVLNPLNYTNGHRTFFTKLRHFGGDQYDSFKNLRRLISQHDIVHVFTSATSDLADSGLHAVVLAKYFGKYCVLNVVGGNIEDATGRFGGLMIPLMRLPNRLVVQSDFAARHLQHHRLPVTMMPPSVVDSGEPIQPITSVQPKVMTILGSGPASNTSSLLRAYSRVKQKYPRVELTVVGPRNTLEQFSGTISPNNGVHLVSSYRRDELDKLWSEADLYVNPSSDDDCPYGILRALGRGLPIVTADAPGISQLVQDRNTGLVYPANDYIGLADRIIELTEQPELVQTLSKASVSRAHSYRWANVRQGWLSLYQPR